MYTYRCGDTWGKVDKYHLSFCVTDNSIVVQQLPVETAPANCVLVSEEEYNQVRHQALLFLVSLYGGDL